MANLPTGNDHVNFFLRHRKATIQFAELMPEAQYDFRPYEGALSFGQLVAHIAGSTDFYLSFCDGTPFVRPDAAIMTPAQIKAYLAQKTEEQAERISKLDVAQVVDFRGAPTMIGIIQSFIREHEAHHKGQLMTYLRMCGITDKLFYVV
jgi:uncharacterized damage-inducible protein DinB